jgi:hypothetical protein
MEIEMDMETEMETDNTWTWTWPQTRTWTWNWRTFLKYFIRRNCPYSAIWNANGRQKWAVSSSTCRLPSSSTQTPPSYTVNEESPCGRQICHSHYNCILSLCVRQKPQPDLQATTETKTAQDDTSTAFLHNSTAGRYHTTTEGNVYKCLQSPLSISSPFQN